MARLHSLLRVGKCALILGVVLVVAQDLKAEPPLVARLTGWAKGQGHKPATKEDAALETLATHVDWLESHLNNWGSVTAKAPDVWGEARLTQYRIEVEQQFKSRVQGFDEGRLNGAQTVSDSALLAAAFALQANTPVSAGQTRLPAPNVSVTNNTSNVSNGQPAANVNATLPNIQPTLNGILAGEKVQLEQTQVLNQLNLYLQHLNQLRRTNEGDDTADAPGYSLNLIRVPISILPGTISKQGYGAEITITAQPYLGPELLPATFRELVVNDLVDQLSVPLAQFLNSNPNRADIVFSEFEKQRENGGLLETKADGQAKNALKQFAKKFSTVCAISLSGASSRRAQLPFPPSKLVEIYGFEEVGGIALAAWQTFREDVTNKRIVHTTDARSFLKEEIGAAVELINSETMRTWWERESTGERQLFSIVRQSRFDELFSYRHAFLETMGYTDRNRLTPVLAWAYFVNAVLLNERMLEDIQHTFGNRPCGCQCAPWMAFMVPNPDDQARHVFAEYVRCRWPIRVFALDPTIDQQTIADVSSVYRQMQLAVVLAFAGGDIGVSTALDTMRKLQRDRATVDLNRTAVAFGHGDDTFGWRFQPRFQTPPVEGNAKTLFRDLIVGGPTDRQLDRSLQIEPGMRECTAVILMPSFVPFVTLETRGNWYRLNRPGNTGTSIQDDVQMSRAIRQMQNCAQMCIQSHHLYRDGEVDRILARVGQLERRLPLQTISCQVPIENTHGGFEILSDGTRELSPELIGWYGSPGYSVKKGGAFFLAGDNFSVKDNRIIAGNQSLKEIAEFRLISRQLIEVQLPPKLQVLPDTLVQRHNPLLNMQPDPYGGHDISQDTRFDGWIDVHIATPYGASSHLLIPVIKEPAEQQPAPVDCQPTTLSTDTVTIAGQMQIDAKQELTKIESSVAMLPPIRLPAGSEVGVNARHIRMYAKVGGDALAPVVYKQVSLTPDRSGYQIAADAFLESISNKGDLFKALKTYVPYGLSKGTIDPNKELKIPVSFTVEYENVEVPVTGTLTLQFTMSTKL